ncbi:MAG: M20 family metallo-hydrolase [Bacteroidales bacterium]|nr:M20 family metallo-hydrolase [Bacteroidales bacterium]
MKIQAVDLLKSLIAIPSLSRQEQEAADLLQGWLADQGVGVHRTLNNLWSFALPYDPKKPTLMLNSHIDTVKPSPSYTFDPYKPFVTEGKLYGLGSNDAGASVVALAATFCNFYNKELPFNLLLALSTEEEISGEHGMRALLAKFKERGITIDAAIVGEPTLMQPAIAERGLLVLDGEATGKAGHAARNEGINAIYIAIDDINKLRNFKFEKESEILGPININVTKIEAGSIHNVVPDKCTFIVDVRTTDAYTNTETLALLQDAVQSKLIPRSTHIAASAIDQKHPLVQAAIDLGGEPFVSPTTSDMALMPGVPTLKMGPGDSARSHTADEFVYVAEIDDAIQKYIALINKLAHNA